MKSLLKHGYIHYLIALVIGILIALLLKPTATDEVEGLTHLGVRLIAIVIPTLYLWLVANTHWTSLLFLGALAATQVMGDNPGQVWANSMGHFAVIMVMTFVLLDYSLNETGVADKVVNWFITRRFTKGRPYAFLTMFFFANLFVGLFMQNLALAVMYVGLTVKVCEKIGVKKGEKLYTCLMLGTLWGSNVLSIASPIAKNMPLIMMGLVYSATGGAVRITFAQWLAAGIPFAIIMFGILMLCIRIMNPDVSPLKNIDFDELEATSPPLSKRGKIAIIAMLALVAFILMPDILIILAPAGSGVYNIARYLVQISVAVPAIVTVAALCIIRAEGKPVMDFTAAVKNVPIPLLIFMAAVVALPIGSPAVGIVPWIRNGLEPLVAGMTPAGVTVMLVFGIFLLTNIASNVVVMTLFFNIGFALLWGGPMNIAAVSIVIAFAVSAMACLTPAASLMTPLYYGPGHITMRNSFKWNLAFALLSFGFMLAFIPVVTAIIG